MVSSLKYFLAFMYLLGMVGRVYGFVSPVPVLLKSPPPLGVSSVRPILRPVVSVKNKPVVEPCKLFMSQESFGEHWSNPVEFSKNSLLVDGWVRVARIRDDVEGGEKGCFPEVEVYAHTDEDKILLAEESRHSSQHYRVWGEVEVKGVLDAMLSQSEGLEFSKRLFPVTLSNLDWEEFDWLESKKELDDWRKSLQLNPAKWSKQEVLDAGFCVLLVPLIGVVIGLEALTFPFRRVVALGFEAGDWFHGEQLRQAISSKKEVYIQLGSSQMRDLDFFLQMLEHSSPYSTD